MAAAQGNVFELFHVHVCDLLVRVLHGQHVVIAGFGIDPVAGGDHTVGGKRSDHVIDNIFGREPDLAGALSVDVELDPRVAKILGDVDISNAPERPQLAGYVLRHGKSSLLIVGANLNIHWRWQALVHHGIDQPSSLKIRFQLRHLGREFAAHFVDVGIAAGPMALAQAYLHERRIHGSVGRVNGGKVRRDAYIGNDHVEIVGRNHLANFVLNGGNIVIAYLDARTTGHLHVDHELTRIGARKISAAEKGHKQKNDHCNGAE